MPSAAKNLKISVCFASIFCQSCSSSQYDFGALSEDGSAGSMALSCFFSSSSVSRFASG